jgi:antiviral helicase SKI2
LTELILDNTFATYEPEEVVALLSCFIFQEKTENEPLLTPKLDEVRDSGTTARVGGYTSTRGADTCLGHWFIDSQGKATIQAVAERVMAVQARRRTDSSDESFNGSGELKFGLTEVVYEWAKGMVSRALPM